MARKMTPARLGPVGGNAHGAEVSPITGEEISAEDKYIPLRDRFVVHPTSVWSLPYDSWNKELRAMVGDTGSLRAGSFMGGAFLPTTNEEREASASIFNPVLAGMLVRAYSRPGDLVVDPFAGGGTRAIIAGAMDRAYHGIDVREDEVDRITSRISDLRLPPTVSVRCADAAAYTWDGLERQASMLLTCPPYWNLERYSDDPNDLSTCATYAQFLDGCGSVIQRSRAPLAQGAFAVWVVGEFRDPASSELLDFPGDVVRLHRNLGYWLYDRAVYTNANPQALRRLGTFDKTRKLVRLHEHVLVFKYGGKVKARRSKPSAASGPPIASA